MIKPHKELMSDILKVFLLLILFGGSAWLIERYVSKDLLFELLKIKSQFQGEGFRIGKLGSFVAFIGVWSLLIALGVPRLWASALGGMVYGALLGSVLSLLASVIGSTILFALGHFVLGGTVERRVKGRLLAWRENIIHNTFWWVLYARLFPLSNSTAVSLLCGSLKVSFRRYLLASIIGFIPMTVVFSTYGSGTIKRNYFQLILATGLFLASIFLKQIISRLKYFNKKVSNN